MCLHPVSFKGSLSSFQIRDVHSFLVCSFLYLSGILRQTPPSHQRRSLAAAGAAATKKGDAAAAAAPLFSLSVARAPLSPSVAAAAAADFHKQLLCFCWRQTDRQTADPLLPWPPRHRDEPTIARQNAATMRTASSSSILMNTLT